MPLSLRDDRRDILTVPSKDSVEVFEELIPFFVVVFPPEDRAEMLLSSRRDCWASPGNSPKLFSRLDRLNLVDL